MKPQECDVYDALNETILSVSLSAPKPGIFLDTVKYVLVLGTCSQLILLAEHSQHIYLSRFLICSLLFCFI